MLKAEFLPLTAILTRIWFWLCGRCVVYMQETLVYTQSTSHTATRAHGSRQHARSVFHIGNLSTGMSSVMCQQNNCLLPKDCGDIFPLLLWNMIDPLG